MKNISRYFALFIIPCLMNFIFTFQIFAQPNPTGFVMADVPLMKSLIDSLNNPVYSGSYGAISARLTSFINLFLPAGQAAGSYFDLKTKLKDNQFLFSLLPDPSREKNGFVSGSLIPYVGTPINGDAQSGLFSATSVADLLSTFIADRFKQEIEIAYLSKLKDWLNSDSALAALLPNTLKVMNQNDPYQYTVFFETLKEALTKDIKNLASDFGNFMYRDPFKLNANDQYYYSEIVLYINAVKMIYGSNPTLVLNNLDQDPKIKDSSDALSSTLKVMAMFSRAITDPTHKEGAWVTPENVMTDLGTTDQVKLFIGLFLLKNKAELKEINLNGQVLYDIINNSQAKVTDLADWLDKLATIYTNFKDDADVAQATKKSGKPTAAKFIQEYSGTIMNSFTVIFQFPLTDLGAAVQNQKWLTALAFTASMVQIYTDAADSNYGLVLSDIIQVLNDLHVSNSTLNVIKNYGNFAVSMVVAKNTTDRVAALEAAALPVGSYRIKRNSYKNIAFQAYAGIFGGVQIYTDPVPSQVQKVNFTYGFTAPLGISYNWGNCFGKDSLYKLKGNSNTIFVSVIDIGAVTAFRLTHDSSATLPEFTWANILAPGIFYIYGFKNSPISVGGGVQYGPQLRSVSTTVATTLPSALTFRAFCVIDIPVFNFFTRTDLKTPKLKKVKAKN